MRIFSYQATDIPRRLIDRQRHSYRNGRTIIIITINNNIIIIIVRVTHLQQRSLQACSVSK